MARALVLQAHQTVAQGVNSALVLLYWQIGQRIRTDILKAKRADYGQQIVHALSEKFSAEFGRGFTPHPAQFVQHGPLRRGLP